MSNILGIIPGGLMTVAVALAIFLLIRLFTRPIKLALKLLWNAVIGFVLLMVVNFLGAYIGLQVTITWITALIAGFFGVPGVIAIILFNIAA